MIDSHIHFSRDLGTDAMLRVLRGLDGAAVLSIPKGMRRTTNEDVAELARACRRAGIGTKLYLFGGMDPEIYLRPAEETARALTETAERLLREGFRGVKLLEGKPNAKKDWHVPDFDGGVWEPFWRMAEERQIPVIMHVNDPEDFWNASADLSEEERAFRVRSGWMYDASFPDNEEQYRQVLTVLERHPSLRILFPHFFFMSLQTDRLARVFDRFPNVMTDVTPGVELFLNLSDHIDEARSFFHRYAGRICCGTDIGSRQVIRADDAPLNTEETASRISLVRGFLESREDYTLTPDAYYRGPEPHAMHALRLTPAEREMVFGENFLRFIREETR